MERETEKRLFLAVRFPEPVREELSHRVGLLKAKAEQGSFTKRENLHLTLAFLGRTARQRELESLMEEIDFPSFSLVLSGFGRFREHNGDLWWMGTDKDGALLSLQAALRNKLVQEGFSLDSRPYFPHVTLGRRISFPSGFDVGGYLGNLPPIPFSVRDFYLMESKRIKGVLRYLPLACRRLENGEDF